MANRNKGVYFAKFAEQAERCAEMPDHMEAVGKMGDELSVAERTRLSVAQKNADGSRRVAWRIITSVEETSKGTEEQANFAKEPWILALSPKQLRASRRSSTKR
jgi:hypothetical protein